MLTQVEFAYLLGLEKRFDKPDEIILGPAPIRWKRELQSTSTNDVFLMHFCRGEFELQKFTYNKTVKTAIVLLRYDSMGRHSNPPEADGKTFDGPHIHLYREGFDDKWAFPITEIGLEGDPLPSMETVLDKICEYCSIVDCPTVQSSLC